MATAVRVDARDYARLLITSADYADRCITAECSHDRGRWMQQAAAQFAISLPVDEGVRRLPTTWGAVRLLDWAIMSLTVPEPEVPPELEVAFLNGWPMHTYRAHLIDQLTESERGLGIELVNRILNKNALMQLATADLATAVERGEEYPVVYMSNVANRVADRREFLAMAFELVASGGRMLIAEGSPVVGDMPWALHWASGIWPDWINNGGFEPSWYWENVGPTEAKVLGTVATGGVVIEWRKP